MNDEKFEEIMENWASQEVESAPKLRPGKEMYQMLKAKKQKIFFPVFARWATVGVAAVAIIAATLTLQPKLFSPSPQSEKVMEEELSFQETSKEEFAVTLRDEQDEAMEEAPAPAPEERQRSVLSGRADTDREVPAPARMKKTNQLLQKDKADVPASAPSIASSEDKTGRRGMYVEPPQAPGMSFQAEPNQSAEMELPFDVLGKKSQAPTPILCAVGEESTEDQLQIDSKTFRRQGELWIDSDHSQEKELIKIKRDSPAHYAIITAKPALKAYFDRCQNIIVNLGKYSIEIADAGKTELSEEEVKTLLQK